MWNIIRKYPKFFAAAVIGHVALLSLFVFSFEWSKLPEPPVEVDVVQATAVDEKQVQAELNKLREQERRRREAEDDRVRKLEEKADNARKQREEEQQRIVELEAQRKQESERKKQAEDARKRAEEGAREAAAKKQLAEQKAKQAEDAKQAAELERKRVEEIAQKAKEEAKRALEMQRRAEEEALLKRQMDEEAQRLKGAREKQETDIVNRFVALIRQKVEKTWIEPATMRPGMSCTVFVRMMPGGNVLDVRITKSSGDRIFDDSVETAVRKAAPLPLPPDSTLFSHFRELEFVFKPEKKS